jgi:PAS domain S-box-containing protein
MAPSTGIKTSPVPSSEFLSQMLNLNVDMVCAFNRQGDCYSFNDAWDHFFHKPTSETNLTELLAQIDPDTSEGIDDLYQHYKSRIGDHPRSSWITDANGTPRWIQWNVKAEDSLGFVYLVGIDETAAKASEGLEENLRANFESQYASVAVGITQTDFFGRYIRANEGFCRMVGYTAQELKAMRFSDITHPEDVFSDQGQSELLIAGEIDRFSMEKRYIRKDGQVIWAYVTVTLTRDAQKMPQSFLSAIGNITSRPDSKSAFRRGEEYFHSLVDPNDRTYWTADADGVILELSQNGGLMSGVGREGLVDDKWQAIIQSDDRGRVIREWSNSVASGNRYQCEYRVKTIDGPYRWVRSRALPHRDANGEILCWYGCTDDIQTQKITEDQLALLVEERTQELQAANDALTEARDLAQAASLAKSQFLANMSHEIRTPMNGVIGIASLLREQELSPKCRSMVDIICQSGDNLIKIIGDILDFSKLEAGRVVLDSTPTDLFELVSEVTALFQGHARSKHLDLSVELKIDWIPTVLCDQLRTRQILSNIISNAIKFTPSGSVVVSVDGKVVADKFHLTLKIQDNGIGISAEAMKSIFDSFTQGDGSSQRKYGGTGLGLAISKNLVELMGGTLTAESEVSKGTTMFLQLALDLVDP